VPRAAADDLRKAMYAYVIPNSLGASVRYGNHPPLTDYLLDVLLRNRIFPGPMGARKPVPVARALRLALAEKYAESERAIIANQSGARITVKQFLLIFVRYGAKPKAITELGVAT